MRWQTQQKRKCVLPKAVFSTLTNMKREKKSVTVTEINYRNSFILSQQVRLTAKPDINGISFGQRAAAWRTKPIRLVCGGTEKGLLKDILQNGPVFLHPWCCSSRKRKTQLWQRSAAMTCPGSDPEPPALAPEGSSRYFQRDSSHWRGNAINCQQIFICLLRYMLLLLKYLHFNIWEATDNRSFILLQLF